MHKHSKTNNKIVRHILKRIAYQSNSLYPEIKKKFVIDCDIGISLKFWEILKEEYQTHCFTEVS